MIRRVSPKARYLARFVPYQRQHISDYAPKRVLPSLSLEGKTAIVTGGARTGLNREELTIGGLGKEFLKAFALSGAKSLAVLDRDLPVAKKACDEITYAVAKELGIKDEEVSALNAWGCDVTNPEDVNSTIDEIAKHFGGHIDVFVGAAGICENIPVLEYPLEDFKKLFNINVFGLFSTAQAVAKHMRSTETHGSIILISSMSSLIVNRPQPQAAYNASKAAVAHLARSMAVELAPYGIRVNSLAPGYMDTPLVQAIIEKGGDAYTRYWVDGSPLNRLGAPEDLRGAIVFMASDASKFMTGTELVVDGGYTLY